MTNRPRNDKTGVAGDMPAASVPRVPRDVCEPITDETRSWLVESYPCAERLRVCFTAARDLATCEALWRGEPANPALLDKAELFQARTGRLVQLVRPAELVEAIVEEAA